MKKRTPTAQHSSTRKPKRATKLRPSRESIQSLRGKYRGKELMKVLMAEKKRDKEL